MLERATPSSVWAVVPLKRIDRAKTRLAPGMDPSARQDLTWAMYCDVLDTLNAVEGLAGILVVTGDERAARHARSLGAVVLPEPCEAGTKMAVRAGLKWLTERGMDGAVIVPADVPFATSGEIFSVLARLRLRGAVIVPASRDGGTNLFAMAPPDLIVTAYGSNSFERHCAAARDAGVAMQVVRLPGVGHDIDVEADLLFDPESKTARRTRALLAQIKRGGATAMQEDRKIMSQTILDTLRHDQRLTREQAMSLIDLADVTPLMDAAARRRDVAHGTVVSYSRKVFIPLTQLCRDVCHYCTFAHPPRKGQKAFLTRDEVLEIANAGKAAGCKEALFTLGDKPELRYRVAREELAALGHETTLSYLAEMAELVWRETGLLPHLNPGLMSDADFEALRPFSISQGIMLESTSERLCAKGAAHHGSPDKAPAARLDTIRRAGEHAVPFTSGILIGIGETREERIDSLLALRDLNDSYGHIQEIIVQNFRPKPGTRMANVESPTVEDHLWTIAVARLLFEPGMNIQAPPNLSPGALRQLVHAGINDWGGVSPVTPDHVNPEAPWPHVKELEAETADAGKNLAERLAIYPSHARHPHRWVDRKLHKSLYDLMDGDGWPRTDSWCPGRADSPPPSDVVLLRRPHGFQAAPLIEPILERALEGKLLSETEITRLFRARNEEFTAVCQAANRLRRQVNGDVVSYVVTRNINYTNICYFKCQFCAFSKGKMSENLRGRPYDIGMDEVARRVREAWDRGASEVCMQGGIHPSYTGRKYLDICAAVNEAVPQMHLHAFSPLEVWQGAQTLGIPVETFLGQLKDAGLKTLPGTAAEILDDEVRAQLCADKINTGEWLEVMRTAHRLGFRSTATIMFGHIDRYEHWARHLIRVRDLQRETGGFTEFVPLPFVHMEAPIYLKGRSRPGPTFRESILMHAVSRLALHPHITNIQASWVKLGPDGVRHCLDAGVNDLGGTLMDESISRSAGASHGQEMTPQRMEEIIRSSGRLPRQRNTLYGNAPSALRDRAFAAAVSRAAPSSNEPVLLTACAE